MVLIFSSLITVWSIFFFWWSRHNFSPFQLPPKKKVVRGRDCWGSEPLGQSEREQKPKQSLDVKRLTIKKSKAGWERRAEKGEERRKERYKMPTPPLPLRREAGEKTSNIKKCPS